MSQETPQHRHRDIYKHKNSNLMDTAADGPNDPSAVQLSVGSYEERQDVLMKSDPCQLVSKNFRLLLLIFFDDQMDLLENNEENNNWSERSCPSSSSYFMYQQGNISKSGRAIDTENTSQLFIVWSSFLHPSSSDKCCGYGECMQSFPSGAHTDCVRSLCVPWLKLRRTRVLQPKLTDVLLPVLRRPFVNSEKPRQRSVNRTESTASLSLDSRWPSFLWTGWT